MIKLGQPNRTLFQASKTRIYSVQWEGLEEKEATIRIHKISNQSSKIYSVAHPANEAEADNQQPTNSPKTSASSAKSISTNQ